MLFCYTASHHTTGFDTLERFERSTDAVIRALADHDLTRGNVVVATCNRFEAYVDVAGGPDDEAGAASAVIGLIAAATGVDRHEVEEAGATLHGTDVAHHIFAVASGLESLVVGEGEIAGQVRRSLEHARSRGTATRDLERVFQQAARLSRGVKNRTQLSSAGRSVVRLALDLAEARVADWARARVLLVGTGRYAGATLAALRERGASDVRVYSRTGRAARFAEHHGITAVHQHDLEGAVAASDLVVACTVAPSVVLDVDTVTRAASRPDAASRRLIIDLGLPRNVDPAVAAVSGCHLLDLETIGAHASLPELNAAADARALVDQALADYRAATAEDAAVPALVALREHVFSVVDDEIAWSARRGHDDPAVAAALRHFAGVLLHTPSVRARALARAGEPGRFADAVDALFAVTPQRACLWAGDAADRPGAAPDPQHETPRRAEPDPLPTA